MTRPQPHDLLRLAIIMLSLAGVSHPTLGLTCSTWSTCTYVRGSTGLMCTATRTQHQSVRKITGHVPKPCKHQEATLRGRRKRGSAGQREKGSLSFLLVVNFSGNFSQTINFYRTFSTKISLYVRRRKTGERMRLEGGWGRNASCKNERQFSAAATGSGGGGGTTVNKRRCRP